MIKLIVFDLWQTLVYRDINYNTSDMLNLFHPKIPKEKIIKIFESSIQTKKWKSEYKAFENLCRNFKINSNKETVKLLMDLRDYADSKTKVYPHVKPMLRQLKENYKIGLLSNSSVFDMKYMQRATHLLKYIDYPLFSFDVGKIKPNKELFRKMLKISKCKPEEAIMIGDKKTDDTVPAKKIGMNAILFKDYEQLKEDLKKFKVCLN